MRVAVCNNDKEKIFEKWINDSKRNLLIICRKWSPAMQRLMSSQTTTNKYTSLCSRSANRGTNNKQTHKSVCDAEDGSDASHGATAGMWHPLTHRCQRREPTLPVPLDAPSIDAPLHYRRDVRRLREQLTPAPPRRGHGRAPSIPHQLCFHFTAIAKYSCCSCCLINSDWLCLNIQNIC